MLPTLKHTLTLFTLLILCLSFTAEAHEEAARRDHANLNRLIRKRQAKNAGAAAESGAASASGSSTAAASATSASTSSTSSTSTSAKTSDLLSSIISSSTASSSTVSSSSSSSTSKSSSSSSSTTTSSSSTASTPTPAADNTSAQPTVNVATDDGSGASTETVKGSGTKTFTVEASASASASSSADTASGNTSSSSGTALTVIIAVAASIGFVMVLWTIFRKWKLARSEKFDQRLNPIDWQPSEGADAGFPGEHRRHGSDTSSFHSGVNHTNYSSPHGSESGHGHEGLQPLPDHDFTAGAGGYGDYANLNRGPSFNRSVSPQPPMSELSRGPSLTHSYNSNVPLHNQTGAYDYGTTGRY